MTDSPAKSKRAREVLARVRKAGGSHRLQETHFYPELVKLRAEGWTFKDMEKYLGGAGGPRTERRYSQIMHKVGQVLGPRPLGDVRPEHQAMLQWNIAAFEKFFLEFSPHDYFPKHARSWVEAFLKNRRLLLNVPPGHAKSEFFMIWIPVWLICRDRNVQILMVSSAAEDAATWALEVAGQLEHNEELIHAYTRFAPETTGDQRWKPGSGVFSVMGRTRKMKGAQFTMESRGMTGRVLGRRADFILVDDPTKQEEAEMETSRIKALKHLRQQVFTRAEPAGKFDGGRIVVIGQRVHLLDMYGELEKQEWEVGPLRGQKAWTVQKFPAVLDWEKKLTLWPERWPWHEIEQAYADVGGEGPFFTMYQQQPRPEGEAIFKPAWLEQCKDPARGAGQGTRMTDGLFPVVRVVSVDPSPTKFNGVIVGDLFYSREKFAFAVTEVHRLQASLHAVKALVDNIIMTQRPDYFIFEESGFLIWLREDPWFIELKDRVKVVLHKTGVNKNSREYGVQSLAGDFEFKRISLPWGDPVAQDMTKMLIEEALLYGSNTTTDLLMALWFVKFNYKMLRPFRSLSARIAGGDGAGWSWMKNIKDKKHNEDAAYKAYQRDKAKRKEELSRVG